MNRILPAINHLHLMKIYQSAQRKALQVSHLQNTITFTTSTVTSINRLYYIPEKKPVKARKGNALLFFSLHPSAIPDPNSLHGGCPVIEGEKWSATKWVHVDSFDKIVGPGGNCTDKNDNCERWAALGECTKNSEYMVGTTELPGYCRRSCKLC